MQKQKYSTGVEERKEFEDLYANLRKPLPKKSLLDAIWAMVKFSEKSDGLTVRDMADYFKVREATVRSAMSGLNRRGFFVVTVCELKSTEKKTAPVAGVVRDVFSSDLAWETAMTRRFRSILLPHMQRIALLGELTAYARPQMLTRITELMAEANDEWSGTRKRIAAGIKGR